MNFSNISNCFIVEIFTLGYNVSPLLKHIFIRWVALHVSVHESIIGCSKHYFSYGIKILIGALPSFYWRKTIRSFLTFAFTQFAFLIFQFSDLPPASLEDFSESSKLENCQETLNVQPGCEIVNRKCKCWSQTIMVCKEGSIKRWDFENFQVSFVIKPTSFILTSIIINIRFLYRNASWIWQI